MLPKPPSRPPQASLSISAHLGVICENEEGKWLQGRVGHGGCACQNDFSKLH